MIRSDISFFFYLTIFILLSLPEILLALVVSQKEKSIIDPTDTVYQATYSNNYLDFLVIGDWGSSGKDKDLKYGSQANVSKVMEDVTRRNSSHFIVNVGDNFYERFKGDYEGIKSVDDNKWQEVWLNVYNGPTLSSLTWYSVAGNHDWYNNVTAQIDYSRTRNSRFFLPSLFYVRTSTFGFESKTTVAWIHIDTNMFYYDFSSESNKLSARKKNLKENLYGFGWETDNAMEEKLTWIESKLIEYQHYKWIFVVGHHPVLGQCSEIFRMSRLLRLFETYRITAYFTGHNHVLQYKSPSKKSPIAHFISGAASTTGTKCKGGDWGIKTFGFLHVVINDNDLKFEYIDATKSIKPGGKVIFQGALNGREIWYPKY